MEASSLPQARPLAPPRLRGLRGEHRLVARIRAGDLRAFDVVYERYHRPILSFCRHMLGQQEDAEDAVQHTFMSAYRALLSSTQPIDLRPWLFAIARNRCRSVLRARRPEERSAERHAEPAVDGLVADVERREDLRHLLADLGRLPEDQRAALVLSQLDALSHKEIARVLEVPRQKVKALVFQARESLASSRQARVTSCTDVREELSTARGSRLRLGHLRRHVRDCDGCRAFEAEVRLQRGALALLLPVLPSAGLREASLPGALASSGAAGAGGVLSSIAGNGVAAKLAMAAAVTGGSGVTAAAVPAVRDSVGSAARAVVGAEAPPPADARPVPGRPTAPMPASPPATERRARPQTDRRRAGGERAAALTGSGEAGPDARRLEQARAKGHGKQVAGKQVAGKRGGGNGQAKGHAKQGGAPPGKSGTKPGKRRGSEQRKPAREKETPGGERRGGAPVGGQGQGQANGHGQGNGQGNGQGQGQGNGQGQSPGNGQGQGPGNGQGRGQDNGNAGGRGPFSRAHGRVPADGYPD